MTRLNYIVVDPHYTEPPFKANSDLFNRSIVVNGHHDNEVFLASFTKQVIKLTSIEGWRITDHGEGWIQFTAILML